MLSSITGFFTKPFANGTLSIWNWTLIVGLVLVLVILWSRVIGMFERIGESV